MGIYIQNPGLLTSVQDRGRFGRQKDGVSPSGAMDLHSMRLANLLIDNDMDEAVLETTFMGPEILFTEANFFAVTGAPMNLTLNGGEVPMYTALYAYAGSVLQCSAANSGCRSYIAFGGGLAVPETDGSKSTLLRNTIGGWNGRKLQTGDEIGFAAPRSFLENYDIRYTPQKVGYNEIELRVIGGPQEERFTEAGLAAFYGTAYRVSQECDRMGYRLEGETIEHKTDGNIISDGIALGAVQVPTSGLPIIMLSERQSMGGYTKIANVISVDLPLIAQSLPGTRVRFRQVTVEEAQKLWLSELEELEGIKEELHRSYQRTFRLRVGGRTYHVGVMEQ